MKGGNYGYVCDICHNEAFRSIEEKLKHQKRCKGAKNESPNPSLHHLQQGQKAQPVGCADRPRSATTQSKAARVGTPTH